MATLEDDEYEIPLLDQRYFGAGIKRKRIQFVPSTTTRTATSTHSCAPPESSASDKYLAIVLGKTSAMTDRLASDPPPEKPAQSAVHGKIEALDRERAEQPENSVVSVLCGICRLPLREADEAVAHESSITHQICLEHSHPPSHLDRGRKGLAVLQTHGWDPDSRLGLGAEGEGMLHPIKAKDNPHRVGLGAKLAEMKPKEKPVKLDAGKARQMEKEAKRRGAMLRETFYRSEDLDRYLGDQSSGDFGLDRQVPKSRKRRK